MPQITTSGIISGIDVNNIVSQLVAAERAPADQRYARQEFDVNTELSAIGGLKAALDSFESKLENLVDADSYENRSVKTYGDSEAKVSVEGSASPSRYSVTVNELATAHKIASAAYADTETVVGTGELSIFSGDESFSITIDSDNDELAQVRDAINQADDNNAVYASIVTDETNSYLILTAKNTGAANAIEVTATPDVSDTGDLSKLNYAAVGSFDVTQKVEALDAEIDVDGFTLSSNTNVFENSFDGVKIDINGTAKDETFDFEVKNNTVLTKSKVRNFVDAYNELMSGLNALSQYDAETGIAGPMQGDATVNALSNLMRRNLSASISQASSSVQNVASLGVTSNYTDGTLNIDTSVLDKATDEDLGVIADLMSGEGGLAQVYIDQLKPYSEFDGILDSRVDSLEGRVDRINDQRAQLELRMTQVQARYQTQFLAMDRLVSELLSTGDFLSQQLDNLPGFTRDKK